MSEPFRHEARKLPIVETIGNLIEIFGYDQVAAVVAELKPTPADQIGDRVRVFLDGMTCVSACAESGECAQHISAGEFREEGGFTPSLRLVDGTWYCSRKKTRSTGCIIWRERERKYFVYTGPFEDEDREWKNPSE